MHATGTAAVVVQVTGTNWPKPLYTLLVTGLCRFRIDKTVMEEPYLIAEVTQLDRPSEQGMYMYNNILLNKIFLFLLGLSKGNARVEISASFFFFFRSATVCNSVINTHARRFY